MPAMQTVPIELPDTLVALLDQVCLDNGHVRQAVLKELVIRYLEDIEDVADATRAKNDTSPTIPLSDIEQKYGLAD